MALQACTGKNKFTTTSKKKQITSKLFEWQVIFTVPNGKKILLALVKFT